MKFAQQLSLSEINKQNQVQSQPQNHYPHNSKMAKLSISKEDHNLMFRKKQWTEKQDEVLLKVITDHGPKRWAYIAQFIPNRVGKQCRERWHNHLNPNINKTEWTVQEEWMLYLLFLIHGGKWAKMTKMLTLRTDNSIKNHWNSIMRKKIPLLEQKLQLTLTQQQLKQQQFSKEQRYLLQKIKQKKYHHQDKCLLNIDQNRGEPLSSFDQQIDSQESDENNEEELAFTKKTSQFEVNIDGFLPETTESLPLKETKLNDQQSKNFTIYSNNCYIIDQLNKQDAYLFPLFAKSQSNSQNFPSLTFQQKQSSDFQLYGSNFKKRTNSTLNEKGEFCKSPDMKARYSQIYPEESQVSNSDVEDIKEEITIFDSISPQDPPKETKLKRRLSRNISIISPTKFIEKEISSFL